MYAHNKRILILATAIPLLAVAGCASTERMDTMEQTLRGEIEALRSQVNSNTDTANRALQAAQAAQSSADSAAAEARSASSAAQAAQAAADASAEEARAAAQRADRIYREGLRKN